MPRHVRGAAVNVADLIAAFKTLSPPDQDEFRAAIKRKPGRQRADGPTQTLQDHAAARELFQSLDGTELEKLQRVREVFPQIHNPERVCIRGDWRVAKLNRDLKWHDS